jgi:hypothetical protein
LISQFLRQGSALVEIRRQFHHPTQRIRERHPASLAVRESQCHVRGLKSGSMFQP